MSRNVELPDDVYARIEEAASQSGNSVAEVIASRFPAPSPSANGTSGEPPSATGVGKAPRTLADLAEGLVGQVAGTGPRDLAQNHSKYMGELPDDVYARIKEAALASGNSVAEVIASRFPAPAPPMSSNEQPRSMADLLADKLGTVASGGLDAIAARPGDAFSDYLIEKKRNDRL